ncbi:MAG: hypothetical protein JWN01_668 [Patescibacteria group bacterium]|nr:hypothetical protein [Patescibacteria group bacterium]
MKLQARFLLLYLFLFGAVASVIVLQRTLDLDRSRTVLQNELKQRQNYFEKISKVEGQPLETLSVDYSFWDEMVSFIKKRDLKFATDNIDTGLGTYNVDMAWVYRPDNSLVYFKAGDNSKSLQNLDLPPAFFRKLTTDHFEHFFVQESDGLLEIRAATVHPGDDSDRKTTPQGFWLVGRFWDNDVLSELGNLTQSEVKLGPPSSSPTGAIGKDTVTLSRSLQSWDGHPVARVTSSANVPVVKDLENLYYRQLSLLLIITVSSVLIIILSIWLLVLKPIRLVVRGLTSQKPELLDRMAQEKTEFGSLAQTIQQFYRQKMTIQESEFLKSKLVELNRSKSEFLAIAAHELKGPVGNVHIFTENLADLLKEGTGQQILLTETERISQQARKATVLINDMYQASKGGQVIELNRVEFDFDTFIHQEIENAQYSTQQKIVLEGATGHKITSDMDRLSQVMTNLIRNASKYSPNSSVITVRLSSKNNLVTVEVEDSGMGIPAAEQPKIFTRFFRSSRVTQSYPGLGLGLSVCHEIIKALDGKIWLISEVNKGSHFYFSLPVSPGERELS